jgi:hypothetical protein
MAVGPGQQHRWRVMLVAGLLGLGVSGWLAGPDSEAMEALEHEVVQLQSRLQGASPPRVARNTPEPVVQHWPGSGDGATAWPWLQQKLQAQSLQVLALRPQAITTVQGLPQQTVLLRLQGRWRDWLALERAFDAHAPWWAIDQWQVVPAGTGSAEVRIELQARWGLWPPGLQGATPVAQVWPTWSVDGDASGAQAELFGLPSPVPSAAVAQASEALVAWPSDPRQWPVRDLRLLGVWWQEGTVHAVLGKGLNQVQLAPGQRVGLEGYRVRRVSGAGVELAAPDPSGPVLYLTWQGDTP